MANCNYKVINNILGIEAFGFTNKKGKTYYIFTTNYKCQSTSVFEHKIGEC